MNASCIALDNSFGPSAGDCHDSIDFTLLFESSIFTILPASLLLLAVPVRVYFLRQTRVKVKQVTFAGVKLAVIVLLAVLNLTLLILWASTGSSCRTKVTLGATTVSFLSNLALGALSYYEHRYAIKPSDILIIFLFLTLLLDSAQCRSLWLIGCDRTISGVALAAIALKALIFAAECREKRAWLMGYFQESTPEQTSGLLSHASSYWLNSLLWTGRYRPLVESDLFDIEDEHTSERRRTSFQNSWDTYPDTSSKRALLRVLLKTILPYLLAPILPRLAWIAVTFAQPFVLQRILSFISHPEQSNSVGYGLIAAIGLIYLLIGLTKAQYYHSLNKCLLEVRNIAVTAIFDQVLEVDSSELGTGTTSTLINNDIDVVMNGLRSFHEIWASAVTLGVAMWLIYQQIRWAFAAPLVTALSLTMLAGMLAPRLMESRQRWITATEKRVEATVRSISSMKGLKLMGLGDDAFQEVQQLRAHEMEMGKAYRFLDSLVMSISNTIGGCCNLASFAVYAIIIKVQGRPFDVDILFSSLTLISIATGPIFTLIQDIPNLSSALVCLDRVQLLLALEKRPSNSLSEYSSKACSSDDKSKPPEPKTNTVQFSATEATFAWSDNSPVLHAVTFDILKSGVNVIIGPVGSGKTSLLKSLLGETKLSSGDTVLYRGTIAFCDQKPWLLNQTLRENIIFGSVYDPAWYRVVTDACALVDDFSALPKGDAMQIGSQGLALSGGQKQRLGLARAIYSKAPVIILDDVFSGLDATTEKKIFAKLLGPGGILRASDATIILVTHSVRWIPSADQIIVLEEGRITQQGSFTELNATEGFLRRLALEGDDEKLTIAADDLSSPAPVQNISDEVALSKTSREWSVYVYYARSIGFGSAFLYLMFTCASAAEMTYQTVWLQNWAALTYGTNLLMYLLVYVGLVLCWTVIFFLMCYQLFCVLVPKSGLELHKRQLRSLIDAPISLFTSTDTGEITNRFSHDMLYVDTGLPTALLNTLGNTTGIIGNIIIIIIGAPWVGISVPVLVFVLWQIQNFYLKTSRQLRYMELESKAPLYTHFFETVEGIHSIRAFGWTELFRSRNVELLKTSQKPLFLLAAIQIWLEFVLDCVVVALVVAVACIVVTLRSNTRVGFVGLALFNLINLGQGFTNVIASWTQLETSIAAVSRIREFCRSTPVEETETAGLLEPPQSWPSSGDITFEDFCAAYERGKDSVLRNINFHAKSGQKIGICGRSGSGKSSLVQSVFRILEISQGRILINGIDITSMPRDLLRSRLAILPQDPLFVPGTIRHNVLLGVAIKQDEEKPEDATKIEGILRSLNLWEKTIELGGLDAVLDAEKMLSQGERQLFCIARAILDTSPILILDEATSSMDAETEIIAQKALRELCVHRTMLCVAHRLDTILDADQVLVLEKGQIVEQGAPNALAKMKGSYFAALLDDR